MRARPICRSCGRIGLLAGLVWLWACDPDLVGIDLREIAGGYRLRRSGDPQQFVVSVPYARGGPIIDEIGWHKPFILFRAAGSEYWDLVDTAHARHIRINDAARKSDAVYQSIQVEPVATAWNRLSRYRRLW